MSNESCSEKAESLSESEEMPSASSSEMDYAQVQIREENMLDMSQKAKSLSEFEEMSSESSSQMDYAQIKEEADKLYKMMFSDPDDRTKVLLSWYEERQADLQDLYRFRFDSLLYDALKEAALQQVTVINKLNSSQVAEFEETLKKGDEIKFAINDVTVTEEIVKQYEVNLNKKSLMVEADAQDICNQISSSTKALENLCHDMAHELTLQEEVEQNLRNEHDCCEDLVKKLNGETRKYNALVPMRNQRTEALVNIENQKAILQKEMVEGAKLQDDIANLQDSLIKKENQLSTDLQKMDKYLSMNESTVMDMREKVQNIEAETADYLNKSTKSVEDAKAVLEADIKSNTEALDNFDVSTKKIFDNLSEANENLIEIREELYQKKEILQQEFDELELKQKDSEAKLEMLEELQTLQDNIESKEKDPFNRPQLLAISSESSKSTSSENSKATLGTSMTGTTGLFKKPIPPTD
ncbi:sodium channel and clathrin linker 1-like [Phlebotomus papatasi]|uniref:sodium channel and clathrin linker 1-like n=1 Tax=Phlebotomus papatasi TaxID=29031 RepID=UPI002483D599|nr:sodium channel and clathrin linker 1-like [Phlebotomus papatasi]